MITIPFASPRQATFITDMLAEIFADAPAGTADAVLARNIESGMFATYADMKASLEKLITKRDAVRKARKAAAPAVRVAGADVAPGYYAVEYAGALRFYRVREGKGRWAGRVFVNRYHSDDLLDITRTEAGAVRGLIAADPEAAGKRFAAELTRCRRCGRMLTDIPTAEANGGYGPECVKKV